MLRRFQKSQQSLSERRVPIAKNGFTNRFCGKKCHVFIHGWFQLVQPDQNGTKGCKEDYFQNTHGQFYYTVMPFGLKNTSATYQRAMTTIFHNMMHQELEDYVDDIVVKSKKRGEHFYVLRKVFERCRTFKLRMNPLKYTFGVSFGKFLGFLVHNRGIDMGSAKATTIATMRAPATVKSWKAF